MQAFVAKRVVNSVIWIVCGGLVILIRLYVAGGQSLIIWEGLGVTMIVYGALRLIWALVKGAPKQIDDSLSRPVSEKVSQLVESSV